MSASVVVPDISPESERPKSAWHSFVFDRRSAFANLASHLVDEALVECVMSRALTRLENTPYNSSDALLNYNQAHSALIDEALAVLKATPDGISDCGVEFAIVNAGDRSDLRRRTFPPQQAHGVRAHRYLPGQLQRDDIMSMATKIKLPAEVCGIRIPDTPLVSAATEFVSRFTPLWLMNHLLRTYVFAELLGRRDKLKHDQEILYLSAIMHDLGLTDEFAGSQRFELDGADAAKQFLLRQGAPKARIDLVWTAISFHTSSGIYDRMKPEIALLGLGVLADATGARVEEIPARELQEVLETWPRHGFRDAFPKRIAEIVGRKPQTAIGSFAADVLRQRGIAVPTVCEVMEAAPF